MNSDELIQHTARHARQVLGGDTAGHDWWHVWRVWQTARRLARDEGADPVVVQLAALLHDIADWKFHDGDETAGPRAARAWLESLSVDQSIVAQVTEIVAGVSFQGANVATPTLSLEGQVVQDADRLDALGAIGVARAFAYGGHKGRALYDPAIPPAPHDSFAAYRQSTAPTINHFYEKLLLLKDRLNTASARRLAESRHAYLEQFLARFFAEWEGSA